MAIDMYKQTGQRYPTVDSKKFEATAYEALVCI
jgi:hypothetical protein